jgi:hypothetical protein
MTERSRADLGCPVCPNQRTSAYVFDELHVREGLDVLDEVVELL